MRLHLQDIRRILRIYSAELIDWAVPYGIAIGVNLILWIIVATLNLAPVNP